MTRTDRNHIIVWLTLILLVIWGEGYGQNRPDVCKFCKEDTTGGYISIEDTITHNPVCNYELLTAEHVALSEKLKIPRKGVEFYPSKLNSEYDNSADDRGHILSWEDLAYSKRTALASYDLRRNLAPEPHLQNVGTKYASEQLGRQLATRYKAVKVYGGVLGSVGNTKGVNKPKYYWTIIITPKDTLCYYMPTTGNKIGRKFLNDPSIKVGYSAFKGLIGLDPIKIIKE